MSTTLVPIRATCALAMLGAAILVAPLVGRTNGVSHRCLDVPCPALVPIMQEVVLQVRSLHDSFPDIPEASITLVSTVFQEKWADTTVQRLPRAWTDSLIRLGLIKDICDDRVPLRCADAMGTYLVLLLGCRDANPGEMQVCVKLKEVFDANSDRDLRQEVMSRHWRFGLTAEGDSYRVATIKALPP